MSLLLTTTCDYAILVAIQQGRHFTHSEEHDIYVQSKLELLLPKPVDDLIPPTTVISTAPATIDHHGCVRFQTTLAYLVSTKLLNRLRTYDALITLTVSALSLDANMSDLGSIRLHLSGAKMVVQHHGQRQLDELNQFVMDKGAWQTISNRREQIKAGLFIVAMPENNKTQAPRPTMTKFVDAASEPSLELSPTSQHSSSVASSGVDTPLLFSDNNTATTTTLLSSPPSISFTPKKRTMTPDQPALRRKTTAGLSNLSFIEQSKQQQKQLQRQRRHAATTTAAAAVSASATTTTSNKKGSVADRLSHDIYENYNSEPCTPTASALSQLRTTTGPLPLRSLSAKDTDPQQPLEDDNDEDEEREGEEEERDRHYSLSRQAYLSPKLAHKQMRRDRLRRVRSDIDLMLSTREEEEKEKQDVLQPQHYYSQHQQPSNPNKYNSNSTYRRRGYSSATDFNIDQLSAALRKVNIFANDSLPTPSPSCTTTSTAAARHARRSSQLRTKKAAAAMVATTSTSATSPMPTEHPSLEEDVLRYHQIGKGLSKYTFYFNIVHADHLQPLLRSSTSSSSTMMKGRTSTRSNRRGIQFKPFFSYSFLSTKVLCPASSLSGPARGPTCFHLRGYLYDIQKWLDDQGRLEVALVLQEDDRQEDGLKRETVGMAAIPLMGLAFDTPSPAAAYRSHGGSHPTTMKRWTGPTIDRMLTERSFPVYDTKRRHLSITPTEEIAKVTVRFGLVSGWWKDPVVPLEEALEEQEEQEEEVLMARVRSPTTSNNNNNNPLGPSSSYKRANGASDPWDYLKNKKSRHLDEREETQKLARKEKSIKGVDPSSYRRLTLTGRDRTTHTVSLSSSSDALHPPHPYPLPASSILTTTLPSNASSSSSTTTSVFHRRYPPSDRKKSHVNIKHA
ncbi:hypothetical protein EC973_004167 [Apophysomyces ossiformis]|uniref:Uncharacterized protein n=1 Tax=Apophysomyces ossiformis TaxID=679940 RepID=A0A8H7EKP5_9FUNG|nr:hypothetical protein EC973_004167 [Apophysomyces ossiformis]